MNILEQFKIFGRNDILHHFIKVIKVNPALDLVHLEHLGHQPVDLVGGHRLIIAPEQFLDVVTDQIVPLFLGILLPLHSVAFTVGPNRQENTSIIPKSKVTNPKRIKTKITNSQKKNQNKPLTCSTRTPGPYHKAEHPCTASKTLGN
mgnify:CR=1 FL=1